MYTMYTRMLVYLHINRVAKIADLQASNSLKFIRKHSLYHYIALKVSGKWQTNYQEMTGISILKIVWEKLPTIWGLIY